MGKRLTSDLRHTQYGLRFGGGSITMTCDGCGVVLDGLGWETNGAEVERVYGCDGWMVAYTEGQDLCPACAPPVCSGCGGGGTLDYEGFEECRACGGDGWAKGVEVMGWRSTPPGEDSPRWYRGEVLGEPQTVVVVGLKELLACGTCGGPGEAEHTCPYAEDINDDHVTLCSCCEVCRDECCDDI